MKDKIFIKKQKQKKKRKKRTENNKLKVKLLFYKNELYCKCERIKHQIRIIYFNVTKNYMKFIIALGNFRFNVY